jgi:hypothetical protein
MKPSCRFRAGFIRTVFESVFYKRKPFEPRLNLALIVVKCIGKMTSSWINLLPNSQNSPTIPLSEFVRLDLF